MDEDYGYQDPEVEIKESGDVDFVEFADSIADGKDHSVTFYDIAPEGSVMLVYNYDHAQDKLEVISYDENYTEETLYVREHEDVTIGSIENISAFTENHFQDTFQKIERDEDIPIISMETPEIEEEPMDFQTLLDLEHSQNDEMEEQQNQEIDFGEQQDEIPDERYEGMTNYEGDELSFLPTAEENMMAEVLSVEGEKPEYVVENPNVHADYGIDKLSPDGQKAIANAMDKSVMTPLASGFIDFELREGFRGNTDGLTSDDISKLREHDPGFGKIIGIDTTKFYTSGPEKNVTIIKLDYEDIKPALSIDQKGFEKENVVPGSIRAYKEFGQSMKVDGMRFGVTNLVTFEAKLKGEDLPYRTTCVMDDSGRVRGFLEVQEPERRIPMDLQAKLDAAPGTETHFTRLDRTDPENRACIPGLRNATPEIRQAFFDVAQITMDSDAVHLQGGNEYEMNDHVLRGDFEFTKKDEEDKTPMANIPFKITSKTTGESHKIVTDENGYYSSASDFNKHSQDTNGGKKDSGLWFGQYKVGDETKITDPDDTKGALPYDVQHLPTKNMKRETSDMTV